MYRKISKEINVNIKIFSDFSLVTAAKLFDIAIPLVTYPYLVKVFGLAKYGSVIYELSIIALLSVVINYGFDLNGVKQVSLNKGNKKKVREVVSNAVYIKAMLLIISLMAYGVYGKYYSLDTKLTLILSLCLIQYVFINDWYYIGMENVKVSVLIRLTVRLFFLVGVFVFIRNDQDIYILACIYALNSLIISIIYIYQLLIVENIKLTEFKFKKIIFYFNQGFDLFYSTFFVSVKDKTSILILGSIISHEIVVIYDFGMKLVSVMAMPIGILNSLIYPKIVRTRSIKLLYRTISILFFYGVLTFFLSIFMFEYIPLGYFNIDDKHKDIMILFFIIPMLMSISQTLARNYLNAFGFRKEYFRTINFTTVCHFLLMTAICLIPISDFRNFVILVLVVFFSELLIRIFYFVKTKSLLSNANRN